MCGIVGSALARPDRVPDLDVLKRMADRIAHRGPDEEGFVRLGPVGLGVRRLRVIDPEGGRQPMTGEDERVWVVFNGEIYNYREQGARLRARGHRFTTSSDTEVIVHSFEENGLAALQDLDGMFAIAVWDHAARALLLARDRLGIKPLYYALLPDQLVFASEIKALLEHPGISRTLDLTSLSLYLTHEYVPAPRAIFRSIRKLPAGHWLTYCDGRAKIEPYWDVSQAPPAPLGEDEAVERLLAVLDRSVRQHLVSDVPLGAFISGGIDSSAVAALAARHVTGRLTTVSVGFTDPSFDETPHARRVATALGTDHHEQVMDARTALELVTQLPDLLDEPLADASLLPTFLLCRFARRFVTVALSGDGGDELFAGYPTYQAHRLARVYERVPAWLREGLVRPLVERLPVSLNDMSLDFRLKRFVEGIPLAGPERHAFWLGSFSPSEQQALLTPDALAAMETPPSYAYVRDIAARSGRASWLEQMLYLDLKGYLGEGVLTKVDRASMACSLEVRVPLLDRQVVELAASLPPDLKLRGLTTKYVVKRALRGALPDEILSRRKKGFGVPLARWFCSELKPVLLEICSPEALRQGGLFRPEAVARLLSEHWERRRDHRKKLYTLMAFQLWALRYRPS